MALRLKRRIGLFGLVALGVGTILGAGIYALIGKAAPMSGNMLWLSFLLASFIAMCSGLSYAELSSKFPKAGGSFDYVKRIFNPELAFTVGLALVFVGVFSSATLCLSFAGYLRDLTGFPFMLGAVILVFIIALISYIGIEFSVKFNVIATLAEVIGLLLIILVGIKFIGTVDYFETSSYFGSFGVLSAIGIIFFAYLGFEDVVNLAEETKRAKKIMPFALILSIAITSLLYVLVAISAVSVVNYADLGASDAPLTFVFQKATNFSGASFFSIIAFFSIFNTALVLFIASTRILYSMGRSRLDLLSNMFCRLGKRRTPYISIVAITILVIFIIFIGNIKLVAQLTNIVVLSVFVIINFAVIKLRRSRIKAKGFNVPLNIGKFPVIPFFGMLSSLAILLITIYEIVIV